VLTLVGIALLVGALIWLFERRHHEAYGDPPLRGFIAGAWWSAVAMTQAGAAQDGPRSLPERVLAVVWMVASVVTISVLIAGITSALTTQRMQGGGAQPGRPALHPRRRRRRLLHRGIPARSGWISTLTRCRPKGCGR
jgi:hypothetical protein